MAEDSIAKTTIATSFGLWEFLRMPFGLKNAAQTFQRLMDSIFQHLDFVFVYLDDILVASKSPVEHYNHLRQIFTLLSSNGLIIQKSKCIFGVQEHEYLGHFITVEGVRPLPSRIEVIRNFPTARFSFFSSTFLGHDKFLPPFPPYNRLAACASACRIVWPRQRTYVDYRMSEGLRKLQGSAGTCYFTTPS